MNLYFCCCFREPPPDEDHALIRPSVVEPRDFMEVSLRNAEEAPSETLSTAAITKLPSPATPPNQPPPSPPTAAISSPARTEGSFMPLRDTTLVDFQPPTTQHHTPDDLPSEHLPSANLPHSTSLHQVEISPRIYLDDIAVSPYPGTRTPVVTPSQSDRRHSRSPNRLTPNRASPPLTRSAQRRRLGICIT
ncbi:Hypothetical predicted protein [Paramuricea clavata]|uniref:Uncharacterized protein n=1 Tax=Paramuricea clavata TaxID=317549 RepID=A0A6S7LRC7_PARCT|nr:Hypothetical predicted protein [Paramuricea clavata]